MITIIMNIMIKLEYFKNQASLVTDFLYSDHTNSINSFPRKNIIPLLKNKHEVCSNYKCRLHSTCSTSS